MLRHTWLYWWSCAVDWEQQASTSNISSAVIQDEEISALSYIMRLVHEKRTAGLEQIV